MRRRAWVLGALVVAAGAVGLWQLRGRERPGLQRRTAVQGLAFPAAGARRTELERVRAFPRLSFRRPVYLAAAPGEAGRLYVLEQDGRILSFPDDDEVETADTFLDLRAKVLREDNEEGLLGLAFAPDYARSGAFYVHYSAASPRRSVIARFRARGGVADPASEESVLEVRQPFGNHNGGMLAFGQDGMLYIAFGDGGAGGDPLGHGQNRASLLGAILRIDVSQTPYAIPPDNPFAGSSEGRGEIWAYGLRNPWRFSFAPDGSLYAGDVGQGRREEIDLIVRGGNYGWNVYEGSEPYSSWRVWRKIEGSEAIPPLWEYEQQPIACVIGGYVYRGDRLPSLRGRYLFGDYVSGQVWALERGAPARPVALVPSLVSFGEDAAGELYAVSLAGAIYRFTTRSDLDAPPPFPTRLSETGLFLDTAALTPVPGLIPYDVNMPLWSDGASKRRWMALPGEARIGFHPTEAWTFPQGTLFVKHFERAGRRLETRVLILEAEGWAGYTYRWNETQTDALLLDGALREEDWAFPSREDCLSCHTEAAGRVLGVRTRQLNRSLSYGSVTENQVEVWNRLGLFERGAGAAERLEAFPAPDDATAPAAARARAYLDVNCAVCHRPGAPAPGSLDLRFDAPAPADAPPREMDAAPPHLSMLRPGAREASLLWVTMRETGALRMPPLASLIPDEEGLRLVGDWIDALAR
ncbi:MAG: PQQ-dependent sugar dehydrogenase [Planctomycetaceae bacterium]